MLSLPYFLLPDVLREIVIHRNIGLHVYVYSLKNESFRTKHGELYVFGDDHGEWVTFENEGWNNDKQRRVWYAVYLDYPVKDVATNDSSSSVPVTKTGLNYLI